jgi:hypothetical protein
MSFRAAYAAYIFGPIALGYFLALLLYRVPLVLHLYDVAVPNDHLAFVGAPAVARAAAVCVVWFGLATGIVIWPGWRGNPAPRVWTSRSSWRAFLALSIGGSILSIGHLLVKVPPPLEDLVHQLALAPAVAVVLGSSLLTEAPGGERPARRARVIEVLAVVSLIVAVVPPILVAQVAPAAFSAIAMLYGLYVIGWPRRRQAIAALGLGALIVVGIPVRELLRATVYGHAAYQRLDLEGALGPASPGPAGVPTRAPATVGPVATEHLPSSGGAPELKTACDLLARQIRLPVLPRPFRTAECGLEAAIDRFNRFSDLAYTVQETPARVPYASGATYYPLIGILVPRFLWPNKPVDDSGQFYGHRYGFIHPSNLTESTNLSTIAEAWLNDGWVTVVLSALFVGIVLHLIWLGWIGPHTAFGNVMIGMAVVRTAADGDSDLSLMMGGVIHALLVYWILDVLIRAWGTVRRPATD